MPAMSRSAATSGRRGLTRRPTMPPATAPDPHDADRAPQAAAPPRERAAMTGPSTNRAGTTKLPAGMGEQVDPVPGPDGELVPALGEIGQERPGRGDRPGRHPQQRQAGQADEEGGRVGGEQPARPEDRDQRAADGGPGHAEEALRQPEQAVGLLQLLGRHGLGHQGGRGGIEEGCRRPVQCPADREFPDVRVPAHQQDRQPRLDHAAHGVGGQHHVLPSQPVGPHPAGKQESDLRDGLDREDECRCRTRTRRCARSRRSARSAPPRRRARRWRSPSTSAGTHGAGAVRCGAWRRHGS